MSDKWEGLRKQTANIPPGKSAIADLLAERDKLAAELAEARRDAERLDWIEAAARRQKIEIARSILGVGFEIGEWPNMRVTVRNGSLRAAIDSAMGRAE